MNRRQKRVSFQRDVRSQRDLLAYAKNLPKGKASTAAMLALARLQPARTADDSCLRLEHISLVANAIRMEAEERIRQAEFETKQAEQAIEQAEQRVRDARKKAEEEREFWS